MCTLLVERADAQSDNALTDFRRRLLFPAWLPIRVQIKSANVFSVLRNRRNPNHRKNAVTAMLTSRLGKYSSLWPRRIHHRNPSITPTIGLSEYNKRHCPGTTLELKPTGDT